MIFLVYLLFQIIIFLPLDFLIRVDEEEEEIDINDQDVSRLVIVTQVRSLLCCLSFEFC